MSQNIVQESLNLPRYQGDLEAYLQALERELQRQWRQMAQVVNRSHQKYYSQTVEPIIPVNSLALWQDTETNKRYIVINFGGLQEKIEFVQETTYLMVDGVDYLSVDGVDYLMAVV